MIIRKINRESLSERPVQSAYTNLTNYTIKIIIECHAIEQGIAKVANNSMSWRTVCIFAWHDLYPFCDM